ncbi:hypothetical protein [Loktanella sp. R86503]|uniref:hypothetical protein n=1 Tax=Loktanella sp. R86503 TaxID=3093847 RepID=UPI0036D8DF21
MTTRAQLERLLGWNLLIPPCDGQTVYLDGLPLDAGSVWADMRDERIVTTAREADLRVYWNHSPPVDPGQGGWVAVGQGAARVPTAKAYALIPPSDPRLVLPLGNQKQLLRGLKMHRPGRKVARMAVWLLTLSVRLGMVWPLTRRVLWIDIANNRKLPTAIADSILYLGTADNNRKTTILPPDDNRLLKHGIGALPIASLSREADALSFMGKTNLAGQVPQLINFSRESQFAVLTQEYRDPMPSDRKEYEQNVVKFLKDLSEIGAETRDGIFGHRCHGDFAPWNMMNTTNGFFVFDWEDSLEWAPALTDAFHFATAQYFHLGKEMNLDSLVEHALGFASKIGRLQGIDPKNIRPLWRRWLENRVIEKPSQRADALLQAEKGTLI